MGLNGLAYTKSFPDTSFSENASGAASSGGGAPLARGGDPHGAHPHPAGFPRGSGVRAGRHQVTEPDIEP
eukprot:9170861-Pyramimonas_sp.AAC.2